jgi:hypothetical protein
MRVLSIRYCSVSQQAEELAEFFRALGMQDRISAASDPSAAFPGAVFPAGESWVEVWPQRPQMPAGVMLQIIVDDADAFADYATSNGLTPQGPMDAHGERIYFLKGPGELQISFQSAAVKPET